jgi:hypothetical protein
MLQIRTSTFDTNGSWCLTETSDNLSIETRALGGSYTYESTSSYTTETTVESIENTTKENVSMSYTYSIYMPPLTSYELHMYGRDNQTRIAPQTMYGDYYECFTVITQDSITSGYITTTYLGCKSIYSDTYTEYDSEITHTFYDYAHDMEHYYYCRRVSMDVIYDDDLYIQSYILDNDTFVPFNYNPNEMEIITNTEIPYIKYTHNVSHYVEEKNFNAITAYPYSTNTNTYPRIEPQLTTNPSTRYLIIYPSIFNTDLGIDATISFAKIYESNSSSYSLSRTYDSLNTTYTTEATSTTEVTETYTSTIDNTTLNCHYLSMEDTNSSFTRYGLSPISTSQGLQFQYSDNQTFILYDKSYNEDTVTATFNNITFGVNTTSDRYVSNLSYVGYITNGYNYNNTLSSISSITQTYGGAIIASFGRIGANNHSFKFALLPRVITEDGMGNTGYSTLKSTDIRLSLNDGNLRRTVRNSTVRTTYQGTATTFYEGYAFSYGTPTVNSGTQTMTIDSSHFSQVSWWDTNVTSATFITMSIEYAKRVYWYYTTTRQTNFSNRTGTLYTSFYKLHTDTNNLLTYVAYDNLRGNLADINIYYRTSDILYATSLDYNSSTALDTGSFSNTTTVKNQIENIATNVYITDKAWFATESATQTTISNVVTYSFSHESSNTKASGTLPYEHYTTWLNSTLQYSHYSTCTQPNIYYTAKITFDNGNETFTEDQIFGCKGYGYINNIYTFLDSEGQSITSMQENVLNLKNVYIPADNFNTDGWGFKHDLYSLIPCDVNDYYKPINSTGTCVRTITSTVGNNNAG